MKVRDIAKASHAGQSYWLSSPNFLADADFGASVRKVIITRILALCMLYDYKVAT